ncbi:MAG: AAA family ATPase [archaeon]
MMDKPENGYMRAVEEYLGGIDEVIETHMSRVFLGEDTAVKAFKAIDLFFVDMRPLLKRKISAIKTVEVDRVYSPDLDTRVATVVLSDGYYSVVDGVIPDTGLKAGEEIVDYVIVMRRFRAKSELDEFYRNGEITYEHARQIGELLAFAHEKAKSDDEISGTGFRAISGNYDEAFRITKNYIGVSISKKDYDTIYSAYIKFVEENRKFLEKRRVDGFIRQCHGDAHSGNMFVESGKVKIFDPIGFKDEFSYMDVISDLAFACMDAIFFGREDISSAIKDAYVRKTRDDEGVGRLLDFYIAYRAFVRGEVRTMAASGWRKKESGKAISEAKKYFRIAKKYALKALKSQKLYIVCGYVASGKTTVASLLRRITGARAISTDEIRKEMYPLVFNYGLKKIASAERIKEWIESNDADKINFQEVLNPLLEFKEREYKKIIYEYNHFVREQKEKVYRRAYSLLDEYLSSGDDVIFDATFSKMEMRYEAYDVSLRHGVKDVYILQVLCSRDEVAGRLSLRKKMGRKSASEAKQLEIYDLVKMEFDRSRIDLDDPTGINLRRIVYHTDTYDVEEFGERDDTVEMIVVKVIGALIKRYRRE